MRTIRGYGFSAALVFLLLLHAMNLSAQDDSTRAAQSPQGDTAGSRDSSGAGVSGRSLIAPLAAATRRDEPVPAYAGSAEVLGGPSWLLIGLEERIRLEARENNYRQGMSDDSLVLSRARIFFGTEPGSTPLGFALEIQDSRKFRSAFPAGPRDTNEFDLLRGAVVLRLGRAAAGGRSLTVEAGRHSFDLADRRLLIRNRFGNTTNAFDGLRIRWEGEPGAPALEGFALYPVQRKVGEPDTADRGRRIFGVAAAWQAPDHPVVVEPYYLGLRRDGASGTLSTAGTHVYGRIPETPFDYDFTGALQWGSGHRAFALHGELGHTFEGRMRPRLAGWISYATGDDASTVSRDERFDSLFGSAHSPYGYSDFFSRQNLVNPVMHLSLALLPRMQFQFFYRVFWLAEATDAFVRAGIQDPTGESGTHLGQEIDLSLRCPLHRLLDIEFKYGHFFPGTFLDSMGAALHGNAVMVNLTTRLF